MSLHLPPHSSTSPHLPPPLRAQGQFIPAFDYDVVVGEPQAEEGTVITIGHEYGTTDGVHYVALLPGAIALATSTGHSLVLSGRRVV